MFSFDPNSRDNYCGEWKNWPPHSFDTNPYTGEVGGFWSGHLWSQQGGKSTYMYGLMHLKLEVNPEDSNVLKGFAVTFYGNWDVYGRRRLPKNRDKESEQLDLVVYSEDGPWLRLLGRLHTVDETLVGRWTTFEKELDAKAAYDADPFGDIANGDKQPDQEVQHMQQEAGDAANDMVGTEDGKIEGELDGDRLEVRKIGKVKADENEPTWSFVFRRSPVEVDQFRDLLNGDENKDRKSVV